MTSIGIGIGDTGPVFTRYRIDTKICSIAHPYSILASNNDENGEHMKTDYSAPPPPPTSID